MVVGYIDKMLNDAALQSTWMDEREMMVQLALFSFFILTDDGAILLQF